jgi:TPR repeat protein
MKLRYVMLCLCSGLACLLPAGAMGKPEPYRGYLVWDEDVQRFGPILSLRKIDLHLSRSGGNHRAGDESAIVCVPERGMDPALLADPYYQPPRAYRWFSRGFSDLNPLELDLTQAWVYGFCFENTLSRKKGLGDPETDFPSFSAIHDGIAMQPYGQAMVMSRKFRNGGAGVLPDSRKADLIEATFRLVTRWSEPVAERLLYRGKVTVLPSLMQQYRENGTRRGAVRALAIAYVLNAYNEKAWSRTLAVLKAELGSSQKYLVVGTTVDAEAQALARQIAHDRRNYELEVEFRRKAYEEKLANGITDSDLGKIDIETRFALAAWGYPLNAYAVGDALLSGKDGLQVDPVAAANFFQFAAASSMPAAQHNLATCYRDGVGKSANPKLAYFWYRQAALLGFGRSQFNLAVCYLKGSGVERDDLVAAAWFILAAENGLNGASSAEADDCKAIVSRMRSVRASDLDGRLLKLRAEIDSHCKERAYDQPWDLIVEPAK